MPRSMLSVSIHPSIQPTIGLSAYFYVRTDGRTVARSCEQMHKANYARMCNTCAQDTHRIYEFLHTMCRFWTGKLLKQGHRYQKHRKAFSKFDRRHPELIVKYNVGLKILLQQGISKPALYCDLVYKFKTIVGKPCFPDQFKKDYQVL